MNPFFNRKRVKAGVAAVLAALILAMPLAGCQGNAASGLFSSAGSSSPLSSLFSEASSQPQSSVPSSSSKPASSKASSILPASKAAASKTASTASVKPKTNAETKKAASTKVETGNQNIKKIAIDQSAQSGASRAVTQSKPSASSYTHIDQRSGYNSLTDIPSQNLYKMILASAYEVALQPNSQGYYPTARIELGKVRLTEAQIRIALMAVLNDNPQIFWLANAYSYGYNNTDTVVQLYSAVSQSQCNTMIQQLNQKVSAVIQAMPAGLSELNREIYLADYLMKHCVYNTAAAADSSLWKAFTSYGALVEGNVVCEGYSRSMQLLSSYAGLACVLVTGQSDGVNHMWNVIRIDGNWYHLDNTWDDNDPTIYNYFNVTDAVIRQTHSIFPSASSLTEEEIDGSGTGTPAGCNLGIPACTATAANYFRAKGISVPDLNGTGDSAAVSAIVTAANAKSESVSFFVPDSADYDAIMDGMLKTSPYKLMTYLSAANKSGKNKIALNSVKYIQDPADRGLTVFLSY
jgi:hypothetical protein